jgi:hypothetical protein
MRRSCSSRASGIAIATSLSPASAMRTTDCRWPDHLPDFGIDRAHHAGRRRAQRRIGRLIDAYVGQRCRLREARLGGIQLRPIALQFGARDEPLPVQILEALDVGALLVTVDLCRIELSGGGGGRELEVGRVERRQHVAAADPLPKLDPSRADPAANLEADPALHPRPHLARQFGVGTQHRRRDGDRANRPHVLVTRHLLAAGRQQQQSDRCRQRSGCVNREVTRQQPANDRRVSNIPPLPPRPAADLRAHAAMPGAAGAAR